MHPSWCFYIKKKKSYLLIGNFRVAKSRLFCQVFFLKQSSLAGMYSEPLLSRLLNSKRFNQLSLTLSTSKYFQNLISKQYQRQRNLEALASLTLVFNNKPWYFVGWIQFFLIVPAPVLFIVISKLTHKTSFDPTISTFHCCFLLQDPHCPSPLYLLLLCFFDRWMLFLANFISPNRTQ